jgi:histidinol-phosphate/aromatic aminotransferase/cobyric acid decarboxylase-like protein
MPADDGPQVHGGPSALELEALGLRPEEVLDFSVSTNPYGPSPAMAVAIRNAPLAPYPDPTCTLARRKLGAHLGVSPERLALGNGAADLLWTLARTLVRPEDRVLMVEPTFSEFRLAAQAAGAQLFEWRARAEDHFAVDVPAVADRARSCGAQVLYLCAPNVPTGAALPTEAIALLAASLPEATIVLDQSFLLLSDRFPELAVALPPNVACVRSLTKEHGIPGVRVGYLLAQPALLAQVEQQRPVWSTSAPAQAAVIASCAEGRFVSETRTRLLADRARFSAALAGAGVRTVPSSTNFFLAEVGDAGALRRRLLAEHRILVRDCASFGLPSYVRLSTRSPKECARLTGAVSALIASGGR